MHTGIDPGSPAAPAAQPPGEKLWSRRGNQRRRYEQQHPAAAELVDKEVGMQRSRWKQPDLSSTLSFRYLTASHVNKKTHPLSEALTMYCFSLEAEAFDKHVIEAV